MRELIRTIRSALSIFRHSNMTYLTDRISEILELGRIRIIGAEALSHELRLFTDKGTLTIYSPFKFRSNSDGDWIGYDHDEEFESKAKLLAETLSSERVLRITSKSNQIHLSADDWQIVFELSSQGYEALVFATTDGGYIAI